MSCSECMLAFYFQTWEQDVGLSMVIFICFVADSNCFCRDVCFELAAR